MVPRPSRGSDGRPTSERRAARAETRASPDSASASPSLIARYFGPTSAKMIHLNLRSVSAYCAARAGDDGAAPRLVQKGGRAVDDIHDLQRFVAAQEPVFAQVCRELAAGEKRSHWMWFVFPQIAGLGHSPTARRFAIASQDEARAYLAHPLLGPRLRQCVTLVNAVEGRSAHDIFGSPDDVKFRSSMTLFAAAASDREIFLAALQKYYGGAPDPLTMARL